jgi:tRNA A37 threonylcarbamoyladenosine modification protein TsaB
MILVLELVENGVEFKLIKPTQVVVGRCNQERGDLLSSLEKWLIKQEVPLNNLKTLAVIFRPVSFSLSRAVTSLANSLAWSLDIPVYKIKTLPADDKELARALKDLLKGKRAKSFITPEYYKEPNITSGPK